MSAKNTYSHLKVRYRFKTVLRKENLVQRWKRNQKYLEMLCLIPGFYDSFKMALWDNFKRYP